MDIFKSYLDNEIEALQAGGTIDLSAYEGEQISLTATAEPEGEIGLVASGTEGAVVLRADNSDGHIRLYADGTNGLVSISAIGTGGIVQTTAASIQLTATVGNVSLTSTAFLGLTVGESSGVFLFSDGRISVAGNDLISISGSSIDLQAPSVTINGSPIGGGVPNDFLQIPAPNAVSNLANNVNVVRSLNSAGFGGIGLGYALRGTSAQWNGAGEGDTRINISDTGVYDIYIAGLFTPGTEAAQVGVQLSVNGATPTTNDGVMSHGGYADPASGGPVTYASATINGKALNSGDYLEVIVAQQGNTSDDTTNVYVVISVTRRI